MPSPAETIRLDVLGTGRRGRRRYEGRIYTDRYTDFHHRNDSCVKMGSDESHCNVSLIMRDKVTRQCL